MREGKGFLSGCFVEGYLQHLHPALAHSVDSVHLIQADSLEQSRTRLSVESTHPFLPFPLHLSLSLSLSFELIESLFPSFLPSFLPPFLIYLCYLIHTTRPYSTRLKSSRLFFLCRIILLMESDTHNMVSRP